MNLLQGFQWEVKLFLIVAAITTVLSVAAVLLFAYLHEPPGSNPVAADQCTQIEQEVETLIKKANYCQVDADCVVSEEAVQPGLCWSLVNKDADTAPIQEQRRTWENLDCGQGRVNEQCPLPPQVLSCEKSKCTGKTYFPLNIQELKEEPARFHQGEIAIEGVYRWGFEDSNFDETADSEEYNIWVEIDEETRFENAPIEGEGSARVTMYGTFHAGDPEAGRNYGHLGLWKHQIVPDKIVFDIGDQRETGPETYCESNKDCWCREFTGSGFGQGRVEWTCNFEKNRCDQCFYL